MRFIGIIPARFASTRFPGKPLTDINGKPMIQWVYERSSQTLETVFVATDDERIRSAVVSFGGNVVMTSDKHQSGTDRCAEAIHIIEKQTKQKFDIVINIQGDEPFIHPQQIEEIKTCFTDNSVQIATLVKRTTDSDEIKNPNKPKVILNKNFEALYFSRSVIPFPKNAEKANYFKHIGMYAYRVDILDKISKLPQSPLELAESLEQLRWIENSYKIKVAITKFESQSIDTPEDLKKLNFL